jgi:GNAT superfamily N-acetyltransferase
MEFDAYERAYIAAVEADIARGTNVVWLALAEGAPVACVMLIWWQLVPNFEEGNRKRGFVSSVYTRPAFRRQGIARRLMGELVAFARERGVHRLILWASDMGRPLYEDLGFSASRGLELNLD